MMNVEIELPNLNGLGDEARATLWPRARDAMLDVVLHLVNAIKVKVGGAGRGRLYRRGRGRWHRASAPADAPARDFGSYVNSWDSEIQESPDVIEGRIGSTMWDTRGRHLELGTRNMAPRPHVHPAFAEEQNAIDRRFGDI